MRRLSAFTSITSGGMRNGCAFLRRLSGFMPETSGRRRIQAACALNKSGGVRITSGRTRMTSGGVRIRFACGQRVVYRRLRFITIDISGPSNKCAVSAGLGCMRLAQYPISDRPPPE